MMRSVYAFCLAALFCFKAHALDLELTQGINSALPVAINNWAGSPLAKEIQSIVENDLSLSGQFKIIKGNYASEGPETINLFKRAGADSVVLGQVEPLDGNRYAVSFSLVDAVANGRKLLTKRYEIRDFQKRDLAHHISDEIYAQLIGEKGIFSTRIAYILVQRSRDKSRYSLEIGNIDGQDVQSLLVSPEPIVSPAWSPDGKQLAYVSFENRRSQIYTVSVETGRRRLITSFPGINSAPSWSPDGKHLAFVLSKSGSPKIYTVDLSSGKLQQLTFGDAIDTEPKYAPDGRSILFTSGRGGSPQIYRYDLTNGQIARVTFSGNYNANATYTPDQKNMVMLHKEENQFNIGVQSSAGGPVTSLTYAALDESPTVSPNSRLILYATRYQDKGVLGMVSVDGRIRMRLPSQQGDVQGPAWSPYLE